MMSVKRPTLFRVLCETSRIISSQPFHFLALSVFFIFPVSFSTTISPFCWLPNSVQFLFIRFLSGTPALDLNIPPVGESSFAICVLYYLLVLIFNFFAVSFITRTSFHGFHDLPSNFASFINYTFVSFIPLLVTKLAHMIILGLVYLTFTIFMSLPYSLLWTALGPAGIYMIHKDHNSEFYLAFVIMTAALLAGVLICLEVELRLVNPIVVLEYESGVPLKDSSCLVKWIRRVAALMMMFYGILSVSYANFMANYAGAFVIGLLVYLGLEWVLMDPLLLEYSQWGFAPLKRSSHLVKGMRRVVFLMVLFFGILSGVLSIWHTRLTMNRGRDSQAAVQMFVYAALSAILWLYNLVADVVLFAYFKELHGELVSIIDEKSSGEYIVFSLLLS